ncbi:MAG: single-stranded DNA-binding protein [Clostridia bacterium]|nr:single-stranded DNA-binding protein [Clostridia bacterium]
MNINKIILMGRLTADPELRMSQSNIPNIRFSIAVNRRFTRQGEPQADFFSCVAFRSQAEFVSKYFKKGSPIIVFGSVQIDTWTDKNGVEHRSPNIMVDEVQFGESKSSSSRSFDNADEPKKESDAYSNALDNEFFADIKDIEGELPF